MKKSIIKRILLTTTIIICSTNSGFALGGGEHFDWMCKIMPFDYVQCGDMKMFELYRSVKLLSRLSELSKR